MSIMNVYTGSKTHERPIFRTNQITYLPASSTNKLSPQHTDISSKSSTASVTMAINSRKEPNMKKKTPQSYEEAIQQLEKITESMQNNDLPLEESLAAYEYGQQLVQYCQQKLAEVEQKLQILDHGELKELKLEAEE
jgi:exodeoxyribonuclease VII small subunit